MKKLKILLGCEESQAVTIELRKLGHEAYSCDLQECSGGHPEWHIIADILTVLNGGFITTSNGELIQIEKWDMGIFFPDCTYLTVSANKWYKDQPERESGTLVGQKRREAREVAIDFFMRIYNCNIPKIAIENPIGVMSTRFRKPNQIIQPYNFGNDASKNTCLWLRDLPLLTNTIHVKPRITKEGKKRWANQTDKDGRCKRPPSKDRAKLRSKTYSGIAKAMAEQWAGKHESQTSLFNK